MPVPPEISQLIIVLSTKDPLLREVIRNTSPGIFSESQFAAANDSARAIMPLQAWIVSGFAVDRCPESEELLVRYIEDLIQADRLKDARASIKGLIAKFGCSLHSLRLRRIIADIRCGRLLHPSFKKKREIELYTIRHSANAFLGDRQESYFSFEEIKDRADSCRDSTHSGKLEFVFILTYGRSGSTFLTNILNCMPGSFIRGENYGFTMSLFDAYSCLLCASGEYGGSLRSPWYGSDLINPDAWARGIRDSILDTVLCPPENARITGFKEIRLPIIYSQLHHYVDFLALVFPGARFIFNVRNKYDVARSSWNKNRSQVDVVKELSVMDRNFARICAQRDDSMLLDYDKYSRDPAEVADLFNWLDCPVSPSVLEGIYSHRLVH